ncbi:MAG: CDP-archaeol synthase [Promethearchaeota archaeon]
MTDTDTIDLAGEKIGKSEWTNTNPKSTKNTNNGENKNSNRKRHKLTDQEKKWRTIAFAIFFSFITLSILHIQFFRFVFNFNDWVCIFIFGMSLVMPAYFTNAGMLITGGGKPIDGGHICKDGRRLFGPGKTWRGFILGPLIFGVPISMAIHAVLYANWSFLSHYIEFMFGREGAYVLFNFENNPLMAVDLFKRYLADDVFRLVLRVTIISYGAALGDLLGSWLKRRLNRKRGEPFWLVDQLDFVFVCFIVSLPFVPVDIFFLNSVIFIFILSPCLTIFSNTITYLAGHKSVPW